MEIGEVCVLKIGSPSCSPNKQNSCWREQPSLPTVDTYLRKKSQNEFKEGSIFFNSIKLVSRLNLLLPNVYFFLIFIVIQLQLYAFSPYPSTTPQLNPPPSSTSTLPLDFMEILSLGTTAYSRAPGMDPGIIKVLSSPVTSPQADVAPEGSRRWYGFVFLIGISLWGDLNSFFSFFATDHSIKQ